MLFFADKAMEIVKNNSRGGEKNDKTDEFKVR